MGILSRVFQTENFGGGGKFTSPGSRNFVGGQPKGTYGYVGGDCGGGHITYGKDKNIVS